MPGDDEPSVWPMPPVPFPQSEFAVAVRLEVPVLRDFYWIFFQGINPDIS
jgi:hypothetical protein